VYSIEWKISGQLCFSGKAESCSKILIGKKFIQSSEKFQGKLFTGQAEVVKNPKCKKCIQYSEKFQGNSDFSGQAQAVMQSRDLVSVSRRWKTEWKKTWKTECAQNSLNPEKQSVLNSLLPWKTECALNSLYSRPVFWSLGLGLEGLRSRLGLEGSRSRALRLETLHRLFFMKFCKKFLKKTVLKNDCSKCSRSKRSMAKLSLLLCCLRDGENNFPSTPFKIYTEFNKKCARTNDTAARNLCNERLGVLC